MTRTIQVQIPENAEAGDVLTVCLEGNELDIPIPPGSSPGDILELHVGGRGEAAANIGKEVELNNATQIQQVDDTTYQVTLTNSNKTLKLSTTVKNSESQDTTAELANQDTIDDGTYAYPWPAGIAMVQYLDTFQGQALLQSLYKNSEEKNKDETSFRVLELGSGMGLVGLSLAASMSSCYSGTSALKIVLSDVPGALPLLQQNVTWNRSQLAPVEIETVPLFWTTVESTHDHKEALLHQEKYHLIVASDVLYNPESIPALVATIQRYSNVSTCLLLSVRWRKPELERSLFRALEEWHGNRWKLLSSSSSKNHCPLLWQAYGNPQSDESNRYFHQTMISVQGRPMSLATILMEEQEERSSHDSDEGKKSDKVLKQNLRDKSLVEAMNDDEAKAFEDCHIQLYLLSNPSVVLDTGKSEEDFEKKEPSSKRCRTDD